MANQRHDSMTAISISLDKSLLGIVEQARLRMRKDRSTFIREALAEKMRGMGIDVPDDLLFPPDLRTVQLNETDSASTPPVETTAKKVSYKDAVKRPRKPRSKA